MKNIILIIGSQGSVGQGIFKQARSEGITVREFDRKYGQDISHLTIDQFNNITRNLDEIIYCAEIGNRDEYAVNSTLSNTNQKNFTHFCDLLAQSQRKVKVRYIGGSWTKRKPPKDFIIKDTTPNKTAADEPSPYEQAKIEAEKNAQRLAKTLRLDIAFIDWISIVPNFAENFTINKFMEELLTTHTIHYTPGAYGRPLLAATDAGRALLLYMQHDSKYQMSRFQKILIPGIFTTFQTLAETVLTIALSCSKDKTLKEKATLVKRTDTPPDFLTTRVESALFQSLSFYPDKKLLGETLEENAHYAFELYSKEIG